MAHDQCIRCEQQGYEGEDSRVEDRTKLCPFHEKNGSMARRNITVERSVVDISTRQPPEAPTPIEQLALRVKQASTPLEKGRVLLEMQVKTGMSAEKLSKHFGMSAAWALRYLHLAHVAPPVQQLIEEGVVMVTVAEQIGRLLPPERHMEAADKIRGMQGDRAKHLIAEMAKESIPATKQKETRSAEGKPASSLPVRVDNPTSHEVIVATPIMEVRLDPATEFLRKLGDADRSLSHLLDVPYSTLRNAFTDRADLQIAKRQLLRSACVLEEVLGLLEAIEKAQK